MILYSRGKAGVCKTSIRRFNSDPCLQRSLMEQHQKEWAEFKTKRFRLLKKFLRYLPSKTSLGKTFIFKRWGKSLLNKYPYLWSFSYSSMKSAYYAGWILTFLPVMGIQIPLAILLALIFKGNIMVLIAIQMISNPLTVGFLWTFEYHLGKFLLSFLPIQYQLLTQSSAIESLQHVTKGVTFIKATLAICLGGVICGLVCAKISCILHKYVLKNIMLTYEQFVQKREKDLAKIKKASKTFLSK